MPPVRGLKAALRWYLLSKSNAAASASGSVSAKAVRSASPSRLKRGPVSLPAGDTVMPGPGFCSRSSSRRIAAVMRSRSSCFLSLRRVKRLKSCMPAEAAARNCARPTASALPQWQARPNRLSQDSGVYGEELINLAAANRPHLCRCIGICSENVGWPPECQLTKC